MQALRYILGIAVLALGGVAGLSLWEVLGGDGTADDVRLTIFFENVEGLAPGAHVRHRGVPVGEVRRIQLAPGGEHAEVACALRSGVRQTLVSTSRFWIVRPRFTGIQRGASGLDTLIKDSYISYESPSGHAPPLASGAKVIGLSAPPDADSLALLGDRSPGDLEVTVLLTESQGLEPGSPVRYRGCAVGRVTSVRLAADQGAVEVTARIEKRYRGAVRDRTEFWVGRPELSAHWLSGVAVEDLGTLVAGVYLAFHNVNAEKTSPAPDGARFLGSVERPKFAWPAPSVERAEASVPREASADPLLRAVVAVHLSFTERDWFSPDDRFVRDAPGVAFLSQGGLGVVLVARSAVDPRAIVDERSPEIRDERLRVEFGDGSVHEAGPLWVDAESDLAIVQVVAPLEVFSDAPPIRFVTRESLVGPVEILTREATSTFARVPATVDTGFNLSGLVLESEVGLVVRDQAVIGFVVRKSTTIGPVLVPLDRVPASLRPASSAESGASSEW
ncbi:MAG: MlaD family protein [Planctomycetota bacterium]